jgi:O-antigen/teichoic acid export membrane protein
MMTFLDIGVGNGLRNKFSEAVANQNITLARAYVSTAYSVFGAIQLSLIGLFLLVLRYIPWQRIFNTQIDTRQLQVVVSLTVVAMAVKLVLDLLSYVLFALQEPSRVGLIAFLSNALVLVGTYALIHFTESNLIYLAAVSAISPIPILVAGSFVLYRNRLKAYRPNLRLADFKYAKSLLSLGYQFFIIQLAVIVIFYTDNLIITQLFGPAEVTTYNVAFRYFNAVNILFTIAVAPYWSAFTEAFITNDAAWMSRTYHYLQKLWIGLVVTVFGMVLLANTVYLLWVGNRVKVPFALNVCMGMFVIVSCWNSINSLILNGIGKVKLQLIVALFCAVVNIPLAILFGRYLQMMSTGVILATTVSLLTGSLLGSVQVRKLILGRARGIWNR